MNPDRTSAAESSSDVTEAPSRTVPSPFAGSPAANSAVWAAYGDALGWISELTDQTGLRRRVGTDALRDLVPWKRRVGGRGGVNFALPRGCYSDDTQLRLAVGRCCGPDGFDVEAFSRVELPVWTAYALGGGNSTKSAATSMARPGARWSANFVDGYGNAGGNGAAMRVQPHAWAPRRPTDALLRDVIRDAVVTHGHPRGILGACLHALSIADLMPSGEGTLRALGVKSFRGFVSSLSSIFVVMAEDDELAAFWLPAWEDAERQSWENAASATLAELDADLRIAAEVFEACDSPDQGYRDLVTALDLRSDNHRGSGTRTVVAALLVTCLMRRFDLEPLDAVLLVVNELGTDTDSIASMLGAYIGLLHTRVPKSPPLDWELIAGEAKRIENGLPANMPYPDLLTWEPPRTQGDALVLDEAARMVVVGLGPVTEESETLWNPRGDFGWVQVRTSFQQTLIIKRRKELPALGGGKATDSVKDVLSSPAPGTPRQNVTSADVNREHETLFSTTAPDHEPTSAEVLEASMQLVRSRKFSSAAIGDVLKTLTRQHGPGVAAAFGALVSDELSRSTRRK